MVLELLPELTNDWAKQPSARRNYPESVERWRADVAKLMPEALKQRPDAERLVDKMLHVVSWESGGDPGAVGDGGIANGLFQSHYVGKGSSPEQQIADAWRLVLPNPNQWTDWGEGVTYQGKPFGALGNYPYDSSPAGGGARMSGGGGGGGGGGSYTGQAPDTGSVAARVVAKRLDAETARQATVDEERRATLETQLGAPLAALPHEEEARTSHGPDPVYAHDVAQQARLETGGAAAGGFLGGAFGEEERQYGVDTGMLYGPPAPSVLDQGQGGAQYTPEGEQYVDPSARGKLRGELEARRQGESQYGRIPEAIGERPLQFAELGLIGAAPYLAPEAAALPYVGGLATQLGIGTAASRPVQEALQAIPGYENLPGPAKAVAENAPFAAFGRARLAAKVGEGVVGGLALYGGQKVDERLGLPALPIVGGPAALAAGLVGGVGGHMLGNRVTRPRARAGAEVAPAAQRRAPVLEPAAAAGEGGTYDYRIFKPDGNVDVKATAAKIFTDLGSPVHAMLREGVQNGALSRSFNIVKAAAKRDEAARLEEASRPERAPRPAVPADAVYGATTQDKRYGAVVKAGVEAASTGNQVALIEQNLRKNGTTWADWGDAQASMQSDVPSWLKRPEEGAGGKAHSPDDVAGLVSDIRAAVQAVREQRAGTDTRSQMGAAARRVRGAEAPPGAMGMLGRDARQLRTGEQNPVQPEDIAFGEQQTAEAAGMREAPSRPGARESLSDYVTRLESMDAKQLRQESNRVRNAAGVGGQEMRAAAREKLDAFESLMERRQSGNYSPSAPPERPRTSWRVTPAEGEAYTAETLAGARSGSVEEAQATYEANKLEARKAGSDAAAARRLGEAQQAMEGLKRLRDQTGQGNSIISSRQAREAEVPEVRLTKDLPAIKPKVLADFHLQPPPEGTPAGRLHQPEPKAKAVVIVRNQPGLDAVGPVSRNGQRVGNMYVGDLPDVDTWIGMTEDSAPSEQQIFQDARYYPEVPAQLQQLFQTSTPEEFSRIVRGYAMGNRRTSSERAAGDVLRVEERLAGVPRLEPNKQGVLEQSKGSMNADIIARALELDPSQEGVGPKLFDFEDLLMGKTEVRTWAGDDPRGGKPFVADTHTSRDAGYIDDEVARYVKKLTGKSLEEMGLKYDQVPVAGGSNGFNPSQVQYELISRWGNDMTAELNKRSWLGKSDWEPSEIQAIGWARVRRELGLEDSGAASVRTTNTFQIAVPSLKRELDLRGVELPRSELAGVNDRYLDAVVDTVHEHIPQARFTKTESAGLDGVRYDVFSSPETAHEVALALSHATEGPVYYYREAKSGKQNHVDVVVPDGRLSRQDAGAIAGAVENLSTSVTYSPDGYLRIFGTPGGERGRAQVQAAIDAVPGDTAVQLRHGNGDLVKVGEDGSHADAVDTLARTRRDAAAALQLRDPLRARWTDAALAPGEHTRTPGGDVGAAGAEPGAGGFAVPPGAAGIAGGPSGGRPPRRPKAQEPAPEVDTLAQMRAAARVNREDVARTERMARRDVAREKKQAEATAKRQAEREAAKPPNAPAARPAGLRTPTPEAMGETGRIRPPDTRFREEPTVEVEPEGTPSGLRGALQSAAAEARALVSAPIALKSTLSPPFLRQGLARVVTNPVKAVRELKQSLKLALNDTGATELNDSIKADDWVRDSKAYLKEQAAKPRTGPAGQGPRGAHDGYTWQDVEGQVLEWKDSGLERMTLAELKEVADRAGSSYSSKATKEQVLGQLKRDMTPEELAGFSNTKVGRAAEWWTRPSNRQAALQLNLNRTNWYKEVAQQMWDAGERDVKQYRDLRQTIEQATQRGSWAQPGKLPAFFSTRAMSGRVQFAWRGVDAIARGGLWDKAGPRREASRAFTATVLANAAMLGGAYAAASAAGLEPSIDWDGKLPTLKVGTHHWDPWAGLNTPARFAVGVVMDTIENPEGGLENVPQAFGASAYKRGAKFLRGGLSPVFGKAVDIGTGRDYTGRKYNLAQDVTSGNLLKDLTAPFIAESTLESAQQGGPVAAAITTPASFLSTSINAYDTPEDTANALAKKNYNGRSYDQLKTPEQLKVIDSMPEADKARVKEAKQDKYKEELKKSGFVEPEAKPKDKVETLDEEDARERRNAPVNAKNREIIAKDPDLEVQRWFFADVHGGALHNKDAVNTAIALGLPEREVKFAGHARDFGRSDEDKAFWTKYGNWLDDIENVRPNSPKNQDNYAAYLFEGKKYKDLKDTEKSRVRSAIHAASIDDPRSEALQVFAGGVGPNQNGEYVLSSPEVKAELEKLWKAYPKARRLPVLEHNGHKTTTLTKPGTR